MTFFFFQAEDGIRYWSGLEFRRVLFRSALVPPASSEIPVPRPGGGRPQPPLTGQIGRASCRERVEIVVVAVSCEEKHVDGHVRSPCELPGRDYRYQDG